MQFPPKSTTSATATPFVLTHSEDPDYVEPSSVSTAVNTEHASSPISLNTTYPLDMLPDYDAAMFAPDCKLRVVQQPFYDENNCLVPMQDVPRVFRTGTLVVASVRLCMWVYGGKKVRLSIVLHQLDPQINIGQSFIRSSWTPCASLTSLGNPTTKHFISKRRFGSHPRRSNGLANWTPLTSRPQPRSPRPMQLVPRLPLQQSLLVRGESCSLSFNSVALILSI